MLTQEDVSGVDRVRPEHGQLPVTVIAEVVPAITLDCRLSVLQSLLKKGAFVVIVDRQNQVLGVVQLNDTVPFSDSAPQDWLKLTYAQHPQWFQAPVIPKTETIASVSALLQSGSLLLLPMVDANGRYQNQCVSLPLFERLMSGTLRPARIGGLATPLGVYMTSGYYISGAGWQGLVATGVMFAILAVGLDAANLVLFSALTAVFPIIHRLPQQEQTLLQGGLLFVSLLTLFRLTPISGLHAAEHMTINAMENDLPLTEPMVRTQPREHQRCGTNLMILLSGFNLLGVCLFLSVDRMNWVGLALYATLWTWLVLSAWKPIGLWVQRHFTTKDPTSAQLASGIKAGQELLAQFSAKPHGVPSLFRRLWGAGLVPVVVSFFLTLWALSWVLERLGWH